jgi:hypothetical protein
MVRVSSGKKSRKTQRGSAVKALLSLGSCTRNPTTSENPPYRRLREQGAGSRPYAPPGPLIAANTRSEVSILSITPSAPASIASVG